MSLLETVRAAMRPLGLRIARLISSGELVSTDDAHPLQLNSFSGLNDERFTNTTRIQQFGFSGVAPAGSRVLFVCPSGSRSQPIVIAIDDPASRPQTLTEGQSIQYDQAGNYIWIKNDGTIEVKAASKVTVTVPEAEFTGNVKIDGNLTVVKNATVQGNATVDGDAHIIGDTTLDGGLTGTNASAAATFAGSLTSNTSVADPNGTLQALRGDYNDHKHPGVQTGSGSTGTTDHPA